MSFQSKLKKIKQKYVKKYEQNKNTIAKAGKTGKAQKPKGF